jgi:Protein of unknown function (DUF4238)
VSRNRSKHQHWVPQFYLRYFAIPESRDSPNPRVWIFSKDSADGDETLTNIRNVCGKRYLYSPTQGDGERRWDLDERLERVESLLGQVWPALAADFIRLDDDAIRKGLALFVSLMHLRNPEVRRQVESIHQQLVAFYEAGPLRADGTPDVSSLMHKDKVYALDLSGWHDYRDWGKNDHDLFFTKFIESEAKHFAELLLPKRWSVLLADQDTFITADRPVAVEHQSRQRFGIGTRGAIVTFPLSPTRLLVMDDRHEQPSNQYYPLQPSDAGAVNFSIWHGASRFLITGRPIEDVLSEVCSVANERRDA